MGNHQRVTMRFMVLVALSFFCAYATAQTIRKSVKSGIWSNKNTWDCTCVPGPADHAIVVSGHIVRFQFINTVHDLTIEQGAILTDNGLPNIISGDLLVNGTYSGSGLIGLTGNETTINGSGIISNLAGILVTGNKTIPSTATLTINSASIFILGAYTITNNGTITVGGNINGMVNASTWVNEVNSTLNIGGISGVPLLATGTLLASSPGNTINYYATYAHTLKLPAIADGYSSYHHLILSGTNTKTMPNGDVAINGDLTINSTFSGSGTSKKIYLRGNWINNGNFTEGTGGSTVTFDGINDQVISRAATENMNVIVVNKVSGKLILKTNVIAERGLTMLAGDIDATTYKLSLGLSATVVGILNWTSGTVIGKFERWISTASVPIFFPIGTTTHYLPATINFNSLTPGSLTVEFIATAPGKNGLPLSEDGVTFYNTFRDGYWSMTADNSLDTLNFNLDLTGNGFTGFTITDNTRVLTRSSALSQWNLTGAHAGRVGNTISRSNLSELSGHYCFGDDTNCLAPVTSDISGSSDVCKNSSGEVYTVSNNALNTYDWNVVGGTIISGNGTNSITVNWGNVGLVGAVTVIEKNACTEGAAISALIKIHALPPTVVAGKFNVPENGTSETYTVPITPDYTYDWNITGGAIISGQGTNSITVNWGPHGAGSVCVVANHSPLLPALSCGQSESYCVEIIIYKVINSIRSGNWKSKVNWDCNCVPLVIDNVTIKNTHTISLSGGGETITHVNINAGGAINTNANTLTITGDLAVNGILRGTSNVILTGANTSLDGVGVITNTGLLSITANKKILSTATLTSVGDVALGAGVMLINEGTLTLGGNLMGEDEDTQWVNATNSTLTIGGDLLNSGKLDASATENTIHYFGSTVRQIVLPESRQYANLMISGDGAKVAPNEMFQISGNFINDGDFLHNNGTVRFNGNSQVAGNAITTFHHLSLTSGSTLEFPADSVNVDGDIEFESGSTFEPTSGTVMLIGAANQQVDTNGAEFYTLRVGKPGGSVNVASAMPILHLLAMQSPTLFNSNGHLLIKSRGITSDLDASIGPIPTGAVINGSVIVQRYMNVIGNANRYISSPVIPTIPVDQFADDFRLGNGSIRYYSEPVAGDKNSGYINHPLGSPLQSGRGYLAWMYNGSKEITWDVNGPVQQGSVVLPVSYTVTSGGMVHDGWNLVGNPYPSSITWSDDELAWTRSADITPVVYVTDLQSNVFRMYNYHDQSGDLTAGTISMGQAFWVKANQISPSLMIHEKAKTGDDRGKFYRTSSESLRQLKVTLTDGAMTDDAYLKINPKATVDFDQHYDGYKLKNESINIYFIDSSHRALAMHTLPEIKDNERVELGILASKAGTLRLSFYGLNNFDEGEWYLIDQFEKQRWRILETDAYEFEVAVSDSAIHHRFYLTRSQEEKETSVNERIDVYPNPVYDILHLNLPKSEVSTIRLIDMLGNLRWSGIASSLINIDMQSYPTGIYLLHIEMGNAIATFKVMKH